MKFALEPVITAYRELDVLLKDYFARTVAKEGLPELRMNWKVYAELSFQGNLALFTARADDGKKLYGFVMYHIQPHLHHMGTIVAACDIIAVDLDERGQGIATKLMAFAEPVLKERGATLITHMSRSCYDVEPLFPKLGFKPLEQAYIKELV